nr:Chain B, 26S proteasome non-ATPase regulatory subunit 1 [Homo sapiens]6UYI_B Chain B, 26S proteasome non-ATPase regulatory subunit 1 [Homo sapiens]6UYJ_B Chain B, 26S proteasome non-ATPase regulatory subunit 1 [Homo sapiens]
GPGSQEPEPPEPFEYIDD